MRKRLGPECFPYSARSRYLTRFWRQADHNTGRYALHPYTRRPIQLNNLSRSLHVNMTKFKRETRYQPKILRGQIAGTSSMKDGRWYGSVANQQQQMLYLGGLRPLYMLPEECRALQTPHQGVIESHPRTIRTRYDTW